MRRLLTAVGFAVVTAAPLTAQIDTTRRPASRADSLRRKAIQDSLNLMRALESAQAAPAPAQGATGGASGPSNPRMLPDFSAVGDLVGDLSPKGSTQKDGTRFGVREVELAVQAVVDPYFRGDVFLGISDVEKISIEQAFLTTTSIPDLEIRLGRYLMPFGKQNTTHRHDLHTIEYPWVIQKLLTDDGLKGTGVWVSKVLAPFGFYQELQVTAVDRLRDAAADLVPFEPANKSLGGLGYSARLRNYVDINESTNFELSGSVLTGKVERAFATATGDPLVFNGVSATLARQTMLGADLTYRWRPLQQGLYKSFLFQGEVMHQINEQNPSAGVQGVPLSSVSAGRDYTGAYAFARYQLGQCLFLGGRYDYVQDPTAQGRTLTAGSGYLEWFPSEFSKLVAGYERLNQATGAGLNRILLQAAFSLGPHKPHPF
ncbi:MAG: hypothetical protein JWM41_3382 [Gemmatimonadetes bacterium]|nr:hypothetical protein [Gemmatimonadota bacterium]